MRRASVRRSYRSCDPSTYKGSDDPEIAQYAKAPQPTRPMALGPSYPDLYRRSAVYLDKIFKGAKPTDLPVEQANKFETIVNLKTAKCSASPSRRRYSPAPTR